MVRRSLVSLALSLCCIGCISTLPPAPPNSVGSQPVVSSDSAAFEPYIDHLLRGPPSETPLPAEKVDELMDDGASQMSPRERLVLRGRCQVVRSKGNASFFLLFDYSKDDGATRNTFGVFCANGFVRVACPPGQYTKLLYMPQERQLACMPRTHVILPPEEEIHDGVYQLRVACVDPELVALN